MPKITFVTPDGERHKVDVDNGYSVMEAAINNNIDGIVAECGGACACATCHGYIDEAWTEKMPEMDDMEDSMLDAAYERRDNSRLTCQLEVNEEWDGLVVHVGPGHGIHVHHQVADADIAGSGPQGLAQRGRVLARPIHVLQNGLPDTA